MFADRFSRTGRCHEASGWTWPSHFARVRSWSWRTSGEFRSTRLYGWIAYNFPLLILHSFPHPSAHSTLPTVLATCCTPGSRVARCKKRVTWPIPFGGHYSSVIYCSSYSTLVPNWSNSLHPYKGQRCQHMRGNKTNYLIWIKFCVLVDTPDVITYENFGDDQLRGLGWRGEIFPSHWLSLSSVQHPRTTVRVCNHFQWRQRRRLE